MRFHEANLLVIDDNKNKAAPILLACSLTCGEPQHCIKKMEKNLTDPEIHR
jgi:hypothetical protein